MRKQKFEIKKIGHSTISFNGEIITRARTGLRSCRDIFKTKEYVVKIDNPNVDSRTGYQCRREYDNWRKIKKSDKVEYFVPILKFGRIDGKNYVVQPRIEIKKNKNVSWAWNIVYEIQNEFRLDDLHSGNWTVIDDKVLIFDYAF
jgi:hypothetical protein